MARLAIPVAVLLLAACGKDEAQPAVPEPDVAGVPVAASFEQLTEADRQRFPLDGELGCAFTIRRLGPPKLSAFGFVGAEEPAQGLIKVAGTPYRLTHEGKGYDAMVDGGTFSGDGITAAVRKTGPQIDENPPIAMESPLYPAVLTLVRDGASEEVEGFWECGP